MRAINPPGPSIPGISQAILIESGRLLVLSGHVPLRMDGSVAAGLNEQLEQVFANMTVTRANRLSSRAVLVDVTLL